MDFKEYLKQQSVFTLSALAAKMWPNNKMSANYLSVKLSGKYTDRPFTKADERKARKAMKELGMQIIEDSKKVDFPSSEVMTD